MSMKGCFTDPGCNNTECIGTSSPKRVNFCCCTGNRCNQRFHLVPATTTKTPEMGELPTQPKEMSPVIIVFICCAAAFVVGVMFLGVYFYKSKKASLFNEIPTVSDEMILHPAQ